MNRRQILLSTTLAMSLVAGLASWPTDARAQEYSQFRVFAASSLRDVFGKLSDDFAGDYKGTEVGINFAGSQEFRQLIERDATPDVVATADEKQMNALLAKKLVHPPVIFAHNELVLVVPAANPAKVTTFADLPKAKRIVLGDPESPIGAYSDQVLVAAEQTLGKGFRKKVMGKVRTREPSARQVLNKVMFGGADAGIVYKTDARYAEDQVITVPLPADIHVVANYPIAVATSAPNPKLARAWVEMILAKEGQKALAAAGFTRVSPPKPSAKQP
jgi:molybdate transport system substrate-binding protein